MIASVICEAMVKYFLNIRILYTFVIHKERLNKYQLRFPAKYLFSVSHHLIVYGLLNYHMYLNLMVKHWQYYRFNRASFDIQKTN